MSDALPVEVRPLTRLQAARLREYKIDFNATQAVIRAGYKGDYPHRAGGKWLSNPAVKAAIDLLCAELERKADITKDGIVRRLLAIARFNPARLYDQDGRFIPPHLLPTEVLMGVQIEIINGPNGVETRYRTPTAGEQVKALDQLAKIQGFHVERHEHKVAQLYWEVPFAGESTGLRSLEHDAAAA